MDLYLREGAANWSTQKKNPSYNQHEYWDHILEMKLHRPNGESNPHPLTLVLSLLGQNVPALTH